MYPVVAFCKPMFGLLKLVLHIGLSRTVKIFKKIELGVSMARLTSNLVNASQIKWKKWKKDFEIGGIWTPNQPKMSKK